MLFPPTELKVEMLLCHLNLRGLNCGNLLWLYSWLVVGCLCLVGVLYLVL